ncbi:MAG: YobA family protein [Actinobacteria bacterium]|nr:YobA family protein [Actinomycetota bacterium]
MKKLFLMAAMLAMLVVATAAVALAQEEPTSYVGYITSISEDSVLVEEDPASEWGGNKGYFTVTSETGISRLVGDDAVVPATFEELEVGQLVEATYSGPILASYPSQGGTGSIVILEDYGDDEVRCLLPEGCGPEVPPDGSGVVQYDSAA